LCRSRGGDGALIRRQAIRANASEAKQSGTAAQRLDCPVASLLAMTAAITFHPRAFIADDYQLT